MLPPFRGDIIEDLSYSRLQTWLECGWKGYQIYNLGFEDGLLYPGSLRGSLLHKTIEKLHKTYLPSELWILSEEELEERAMVFLDQLWCQVLGGREELQYLKKYIVALQEVYQEVQKIYLKTKKKPTSKPWLTNIFKEGYAPFLTAKVKRIEGIAKNSNIVQWEPLYKTISDTYLFLNNYCRLIKTLKQPETIYSELDLESYPEIQLIFHVMNIDYLMRGSIDQLWRTKDGDMILYDVKTNRQSWTPNIVRHMDQLHIYGLYTDKVYGRKPDRYGIMDIRTDGGIVVETRFRNEDNDRFTFRFQKKLEAYEFERRNGIYAPVAGTPHSICSYCAVGHAGICPAYAPQK